MTFIQEKVEEAKQHVWGYCCKSCGGGGAGETPESTCHDCKGLGIVNWNFDWLTTTLTQAIEEGRRMERQRVRKDITEALWNKDGSLKSHDISYIVSMAVQKTYVPSTGDNTSNV